MDVHRSAVKSFSERLEPPDDASITKSEIVAEPKGPPHSVAAALIAGLLLIIAAGASAFVTWQFSNIQKGSRSNLLVTAAVHKLLTDLVDTETGQRGYLLTENPEFLQPYNAGLSSIKSSMPSLEKAVAGDASQLATLAEVRASWAAKVAEMERTIDLVRNGQRQQAIDRIKTGDGKALMDSVRLNLDVIAGRTAQRYADTERRFARWQALSIAVGLLSLVTALVIGVWQVSRTQRLVSVLNVQHANLAGANNRLETAVEQRTRHLDKITSLLTAITYSATEAIYAKDREGRMIFVNRAVLGHLGQDRSAVMGRTEADFHHNAAEAQEIMRHDREIMASGAAGSVEETITTPAGCRTFLSHKAPLKSPGGDVFGIVCVSTDITERKFLEERRDLSERRFRAAILAVNGVVWTANAVGEITGEHPEWTALTGQARADYEGYGWTQMLHPDDVGPTIEAWQRAMAEKSLFITQYRLRCLDGAWHHIAVRAVPVLDASGEMQEWVGLNIDVSEERETQRQLQESLDRINLALDAAKTGAWEYVPAEKRMQWDARTAEIWGLPHDEGNGPGVEVFRDLVNPGDRAEAMAVFGEAVELHDGQHFSVEHRITTGGAERWVATSAKVLASPNSPPRLIGTVRDVTQRVLQEQRVRFLMKELSHRTKNSLAVIQAIARTTISRAGSLAQFQSEFEARLNSMAQSLNLLVQNNWEGIAITDLIKSQLDHHLNQSTNRIVLCGPRLHLKAEAAQNIGLALHELSTNAAKYGALSTELGQVIVTWLVQRRNAGDEVFSLHWEERGGPAVSEPASKGFGHRVIQRVVRDALAGTSNLVFDADGVNWHLEIPATHIRLDIRA